MSLAAVRSAATIAFALVALAPAPAQEVSGVVEESGAARVAIAVPTPRASAEAREAAAEIADAVRYDLEFSDWFEIVDPATYALAPAPDRGRLDHEAWRGLGAAAVVDVEVAVKDGKLDVIARVHDTEGGKLVLNYRYGGAPSRVRRIAHQLSDDIVLHYTGRPGIAQTWIAFSSRHGENKEIYLMDYDGRRVRRLTDWGTINLAPAWSPVANSLAFLSFRGDRPGVWVLDGDGRVSRTPALSGEMNVSPDWSPDGRRLAYSGTADGDFEIYSLNLASGRNDRLTRHPAIDISPAYSPNGREIAFTSDRSGKPQVYLMDAEGLNVRRLTTEGDYNDSAAWSPDGTRLAYVSRIDGRFDVFVRELESGATRRLTADSGNNENPRWSPDGRHIVFASDRAGTWDIYTMRADGSRVTRLTRGTNSYTPDWSRVLDER